MKYVFYTLVYITGPHFCLHSRLSVMVSGQLSPLSARSDLNWDDQQYSYVVKTRRLSKTDVLYSNLLAAEENWSNDSCIKFVEARETEDAELNIVRHTRCSRDDGDSFNSTTIFVNDECGSVRDLTHFLGHYLGLKDEHMNEHWSSYLEWKNDDSLSRPPNYTYSRNALYDVTSVMHIPSRSKQTNHKAAFLTKKTAQRGVPGRFQHPSFYDLKSLILLYGCIGSWCLYRVIAPRGKYPRVLFKAARPDGKPKTSVPRCEGFLLSLTDMRNRE
ncbi:uncharacterized protein LOC135207212 isoform X1 [Macrobrachium nipponense]|uniref:uncharacterized protein LOC135207212 isoform X1 n=1 Tax=Macrobrachium nipponense TaxID=159736 RepID=UPI0030C886B0